MSYHLSEMSYCDKAIYLFLQIEVFHNISEKSKQEIGAYCCNSRTDEQGQQSSCHLLTPNSIHSQSQS